MNARAVVAAVAAAGFLCGAGGPIGAQQGFTLSASPTSGAAPLSVTFTVSPMPPGDSAIDFGDGSAAGAVRPVQGCAGCPPAAGVTHVYQSNGSYVARLSASSSIVGSATVTVGSGAH
jgi:PKD repeat protein